MRRLTAAAGAAALLAAASAAAADEHGGYAFDNPRLLTQQLVWGRLHGARLLALACWDRGDAPAALAYADWLDGQWPAVRAATRDLARHYFGRDEAPLAALDAALGLRPQLDTPGKQLAAACATLPAALAAPRFDLARFYAERREAIRRGDPEFPGAVWQEEE